MDFINSLNEVISLVVVAGVAIWAVSEIKSITRELSKDIKYLSEAVLELKEQQHEYLKDYALNKDTTSVALSALRERLSVVESKCLHYHGGGAGQLLERVR